MWRVGTDLDDTLCVYWLLGVVWIADAVHQPRHHGLAQVRIRLLEVALSHGPGSSSRLGSALGGRLRAEFVACPESVRREALNALGRQRSMQDVNSACLEIMRKSGETPSTGCRVRPSRISLQGSRWRLLRAEHDDRRQVVEYGVVGAFLAHVSQERKALELVCWYRPHVGRGRARRGAARLTVDVVFAILIGAGEDGD